MGTPSQGSAAVAAARVDLCTLDLMPVFAKEMIAGGVAGEFSKTAIAPLERLKILLQTRTNEFRSLGLLKSLNKLRKHDGVLGFYKGNGASVLRIVPYAALHYMAYERYRCWILGNCPTLGTGPVVDLLAGSASGGTAVLCTYPLDLARTKLAFQASCTPYSFIEPSLLFGPKMLTATSLRSPIHQHPAVPSPGLCHLKGRGGATDASD